MTFPVEDRLKEIYETLPHSERLLADLLLDFPGVLATHAMSEVVQRAKTSNAAATRLVKRLGYKNVQEIRKQVRQARED
ncbi:MAG: MurR/RpiR family transcriptional regulator, partial [Advenella sp.]